MHTNIKSQIEPKPLSPLMQTYRRVKQSAPDTLLLVRLGDFYEAFWDDATVISKVLTIAHTKRNDVPMAGIPYHCLDKWTAVLRGAGHKVNVIEDWKTA